MAITRVQSKTANSAGASVLSLAVTLDSAPTAGNIIVLVAAVNAVTGLEGILLGDGTITWTGFTSPVGASNTSLLIAVGRVFSGASATITVSQQSTGGMAIAAAEYSGFTNAVIDRSISATGSSTSPASGATGTTSNANELWVGGISLRASSGVTFSSPTNSFAIVAQDKSSAGTTSDRSVCLLERIVSTTGTPNAGATSSGTGVWVASVITIAAVTGGGLLINPGTGGGLQ